jgi:hypothetical protein
LEKLRIASAQKIDWLAVNQLSSIKNICLVEARVNNLENLDREEITTISIHQNSKFRNLGINKRLTKLTNLSITHCNNFNNLDDIKQYPTIKKLVIEDCANIQSLEPILELPCIETISFFGTKVTNGNIKKLLQIKTLKELNFNDSTAYDLKMLDALIALNVPDEKWPFMYKNPKGWKRLTKYKH